MVSRNKRERLELRAKIKDLWVLGFTHAKIAETLQTKFNIKISEPGVRLHVIKIEKELESMISEDAIDKYVSEFVRMRTIFDNESEEMSKIIDTLSDDDPKELEAKIKLINARHAVRLDKMKMLQDIELPIAIKKYKREREKFNNRLEVVTEIPTLTVREIHWPKD